MSVTESKRLRDLVDDLRHEWTAKNKPYDRQEAIKLIQQAIAEEKGNLYAYIDLSIELRQLGEYQEALETVIQGIEIGQLTPGVMPGGSTDDAIQSLYGQAGLILSLMANYSEAEKYLLKSLEIGESRGGKNTKGAKATLASIKNRTFNPKEHKSDMPLKKASGMGCGTLAMISILGFLFLLVSIAYI